MIGNSRKSKDEAMPNPCVGRAVWRCRQDRRGRHRGMCAGGRVGAMAQRAVSRGGVAL